MKEREKNNELVNISIPYQIKV